MASGGRMLAGAILVLTGIAVAWAFHVAGSGRPREVRTSLSVVEALGSGEVEDFARALAPREFRFPQDHGSHPEYRTEWWYLTGNLEGPQGEPFGFQFTVFRSALGAQVPRSSSSWATNQVYMGHLAFTNGPGSVFRSFERFARGAQGLAGARIHPFRVWLEDWRLESAGPRPSGETPWGIFPLRLRAAQDDYGISLELSPEKPPVLQGDRGLSQKGPQPGNASYYYSFTRLSARGSMTLDGQEVPVRGTAWLDREWSTSVLSEDQVGWDWFALQLSDGSDLMYYQLRRQDGTPGPFSAGVLVDRAGDHRELAAREVRLSVVDHWESPLDGTPYPSRWILAIPSEDLELEIVPLLPAQELNLTFRYWEGAVSASGRRGSNSLEGRGYVELTGYADDSGQGRPELQTER